MKKTSVNYDRLSEASAKIVQKSDCKVIDFTKFLSGRVMNGRAVSLGTATGRAMIIRENNDMKRVKDGVIIISKNAFPELAVVMNKVSGIVTEYGGQSACALGYAREYGVPAVAGIPDITEKIEDGDVIEVNGTTGTVEFVKYKNLRQNKGNYRQAN
jgi:phosphoenolpyruvate synthase/pyruvate phosphate dikinase